MLKEAGLYLELINLVCSQPGFPTKSDSILFHAFCPFFKTKQNLLELFTAKKGRRGREKGENIKRAMEKNVSKIYGSYIATERL